MSILEVNMVFKLRTSKETMETFDEIGTSLHLQPYALCKIAIALSLRRHDVGELDFQTNNDGLELNRQTITGECDELFKALVISYHGESISDDDYFPKYLKAHIDRGAKMLYSEFKYSNGNFYNHLLEVDKGV